MSAIVAELKLHFAMAFPYAKGVASSAVCAGWED